MAKIARESDFIQATCVPYNKSGHSAATGSMTSIYLRISLRFALIFFFFHTDGGGVDGISSSDVSWMSAGGIRFMRAQRGAHAEIFPLSPWQSRHLKTVHSI